MNFTAIMERLTGISCPLFGISWSPPEPERKIARRVINFLEDRRVLYWPASMEVPAHCVHSVIEIRHYLTSELTTLPEKSTLADYIRAMRASCRKFLEQVQKEDRVMRYASQPDHYANWAFSYALGEMRGTFGNMITQIAAAYGLDIEEELASIIPAAEDEPIKE